MNKPSWLSSKIPSGDKFFSMKRDLSVLNLATVCEESKCPNISECWSKNTATFLLLGKICTRNCRFCHVTTGDPNGLVDKNEPENIAQRVLDMNLKYAVLTMVTRDDLPDGGASHLVKVVEKLQEKCSEVKIELLTSDFQGNKGVIDLLLQTKPVVFAHNIETVRRLTPLVRSSTTDYGRSLAVLEHAKKAACHHLLTKSSLMLGLGETEEEIDGALLDLKQRGVDLVTIGQYLSPSKRHFPVAKYVHPDEFTRWGERAREIGLIASSGPLVRSSFRAGRLYEEIFKSTSEVRS